MKIGSRPAKLSWHNQPHLNLKPARWELSTQLEMQLSRTVSDQTDLLIYISLANWLADELRNRPYEHLQEGLR
jgi:hypothetical protein